MLNKIDSYIFGLFISDGSLSFESRNRGRMIIELNIKDICLLQDIVKYYPDGKIRTRKRTTNFKSNYETCILAFYKKEFRDKFISEGFPISNKTLTANTPNAEYSEMDFWRGIIDGDGSVGYTKDNEPFISVTIKSEDLKNEYLLMLKKCIGVTKQIKRNRRDDVYNIIIKNEDAIKLARLLYGDAILYLERKRKIAISFNNWKRIRPKKEKGLLWSKEEVDYLIAHGIKETINKTGRSEKAVKTKLWKIKNRKK